MRVIRGTVRGTRRVEREFESWAALGVLAAIVIVATAIVLATFVIPAVIGGALWLFGLLLGGDSGAAAKRRGAWLAGWPWRGLARAIGK